MINQFQGESRKDAVVNHFGFDIEEEASFLNFIHDMGETVDSPDEVLEELHERWESGFTP
jgi:hypothetical protein